MPINPITKDLSIFHRFSGFAMSNFSRILPTTIVPTPTVRLTTVVPTQQEKPSDIIPIEKKEFVNREFKAPAYRVIRSVSSSAFYLDDVVGDETAANIAVKSYFFSIPFIPLSSEEKIIQQQLFTQFLFRLDSLCSQTNQNGRVIVLSPHRQSGLGNNIRSLMTAFYIAVTTDRGVRGIFV